MRNSPLLELERLYDSQYVSRTDLDEIVAKYQLVPLPKGEIAKQKLKYLLGLKVQEYRDYCKGTGQMNYYLTQREVLNRKFIKREQSKPYKIEGNMLDPQQTAAVVACEDAELILAPAGSGKTASLLAKLNYLTDYLRIPAEEILVIAFTNKVVAELKERVKQTDVEIRTFHSLGNRIVKERYRDYKLVTENETRKMFHKIIKEIKEKDSDYRALYDQYLNKHDTKDVAATFLNLISYSQNKKLGDEEALVELFISILGLQKSERVTLEKYKKRLEAIVDAAARAEALEFNALYAPVALKYAEQLERQRKYDFADMLNMATDIVEKMPIGAFSYRYILVDEAQDLSTAKYLMLKAILSKCKRVKLFAVGDDWQSIYRFAGSNLRVLDDFEKIFERETYRGLIELTYRFGQPTARVSNKFIQRNPHQSRKKVQPHVKRRTPILVKLNLNKQPRTVPQDYETVNLILSDLCREYGTELRHKRVQIIARYNRDVYRLVDEVTGKYRGAKLLNRGEAGMELKWKIGGVELTIPFCSMHKAKGITRDIIIVINVNSGNHGIPATRGNDVKAEVLLTVLDDYPHAEERRLFYVAVTRAKERTILVADASRISPFVFEVCPKLEGADVRVCPKCHRGIMQEKKRRDGKVYYACSNFTGGCKYQE